MRVILCRYRYHCSRRHHRQRRYHHLNFPLIRTGDARQK